MKSIVYVFLVSGLVWAQSFQGSLRGRVTDPDGAATSKTKITITDEATFVTRATTTNDQGEYVFTAVTPATYTVSAEAGGFKRLERKGVLISTQAAATVDLALELGPVTEKIDVTADAPLLETGEASTGQAIESQKITDLPILGRNSFFTAKLAQTVVFVAKPKDGPHAGPEREFPGFHRRRAGANQQRSGGRHLDHGFQQPRRVCPLAGIGPGGETSGKHVRRRGLPHRRRNVQFAVALGTNDWHGSAVGHIRQTDWLANSFFSNRAGLPIADQPFRDWGGSLGGPVAIPKLYDGHNRTFFFVATEAYRQQDGGNTALSVPTALERAGNFSQSAASGGGLQTIYDPLSTTSAGTRLPFADNIIPPTN